MGTAKIIAFPRSATPRKLHQSLRRPHPSSAQARLNAAASQGYWWGIQDAAPWIGVAFVTGICLTAMVLG